MPGRGSGPSKPTGEEVELYFELHGSVAAVHRALVARGRARFCERHYQRMFDTELALHERAYAKQGHAGRVQCRITRQYNAPYANACWQADHFQFDVLVMVPREKKPKRPWVTMFIDDRSRFIEGFAISVVPTAGSVCSALYGAIVQGPPESPGGGIPDSFLWDGGKEFLADAISEIVLNLGSQAIPTSPYTPQQKGKIERLHRTIIQEFLIGLPFATNGPRRNNGTLYGPDVDPMSLESFVTEFEAWVYSYNYERPHSALGNRTPAEVLEADPSPRRRVPAEQLRWLLMQREERKVEKRGVFVKGHYYIAPELNIHIGNVVEVAWVPHDQRKVEVFAGGEHVCTAYPQDALSKEQVDRLVAKRQQDEKRASDMRKRVSRKQRVRLLPMTTAQPPEDATVITRSEADLASGTRSTVVAPPAASAKALGVEGLFEAVKPSGENS
jgi:putative transposase